MLSKRIVREYFTFNKRERNGFLVLVGLLIMAASIHLYVRTHPGERNELTPAQKQVINGLVEQSEANRLLREQEQMSFASTKTRSKKEPVEVFEPQWEKFDPNSVSSDVLKASGLKPYLAERIVKYRNSGGSFKNVKSLARIYGMDSIWLKQAEPYLLFPEIVERNFADTSKRDVFPEKVLEPINLNLADSTALVSIRGVGPFYASQVVELRNELGGFYTFDQLNEVYKIRPETLLKFRERCFIDSAAVKRIPLNTATLEELAGHKYIKWKTAKVIIAYREAHGSYRKVEDILKTDVVTDSMYRKIAPYLTIE